MEQTPSKHLVGCIVCGLLTVFGVVASIITLISGSRGIAGQLDWVGLVLLVLIGYYAFAGYKRPHGNLLKYIILIRAVPCLVGIYLNCQSGNTPKVLLLAVTIGLLCYIAGRLAKAKENMILFAIAIICELLCLISDLTSGVAPIGVVTPLVVWLDICVAYFLRYKEHKEAGLADAPKK